MAMTIFENGAFLPGFGGASRGSAPTALVADGEVIRYLGSVEECRDFTGGRATTIDLNGAYVIPGFTDSHIHTAQLALQSVELDLSAARSLEETVSLVGRAVAVRAAENAGALPGGTTPTWLFGGRWNNRSWTDHAMPTKHHLDAVTGDVPVALHHSDLHTYWLNSRALQLLGVDTSVPDPSGGTISRGATGDATGILGEAAAFAAERFFAEQTSAELDATIGGTLERLLSFGVTSIHDIDGQNALRSFLALRSAGQLNLRVHKLMPVSMLDELIDDGITSGAGDNWLRYGAVKIFGDGSLSSQTCLLNEPYSGGTDRGIAVTPSAELNELVRRCNAHGLAAAVHAIGDGAAAAAITALEHAERSESRSVLPNRIEHLQHIRPADIRRFGKLAAVACMQPASCTSDIDLVDDVLAGRHLASYAWRSITAAGGTIAFSSDAPVESINPFSGIYAAVTRQRPNGYPAGGWQPHERMTRVEAFAAYTSGAATASGERGRKGALAPGQLADFAVLDRDPTAVDDAGLLATAVLLTVVGGGIRWSR